MRTQDLTLDVYNITVLEALSRQKCDAKKVNEDKTVDQLLAPATYFT